MKHRTTTYTISFSSGYSEGFSSRSAARRRLKTIFWQYCEETLTKGQTIQDAPILLTKDSIKVRTTQEIIASVTKR